MMTLKQDLQFNSIQTTGQLGPSQKADLLLLPAAMLVKTSAVQVSNKIPAVSNSSKVGYTKRVIWFPEETFFFLQTLKFSFSENATKICAIFLMVLTSTK